MTRITVGIITCRRPVQLANTLRSLAKLKLPDDAEISLLVVDNDLAHSAKSVVETEQMALPFSTSYTVEEQRGIPYARNKVLSWAEASDYIAFIDDDDTADSNWLAALYQTAKNSKADVVKGWISYSFPKGKEYLSTLDIFANPEVKTGDALDSAWTNNVLFATHIYREHGITFDTTFTGTGGSDHHFFHTAHRHGARIVMCREAVVYSAVPEERTQFGWLARRHARIGATLTMSTIRHHGLKEAARQAMHASGDSLRYCLRLMPRNLQDKKRLLHPIMVLCFMGGRIIGLFNLSPREYG